MRILSRWAAAGVLVVIGFAAAPTAVPIYDGVGAPDQPYRFVTAPLGSGGRPAPTGADGRSPVKAGLTTAGLSLTTGEVGPQVSLFVPSGALATTTGPVTIHIEPLTPTEQPSAARIDGNVVRVTALSPAGPAMVVARMALASIALRSTTARQPGPVVERRTGSGQPWQQVETSRGGQDIYVAAFTGPADYALAFPTDRRAAPRSLLPFLLGGAILVLALIILTVRRQSTRHP